MHRDESLARSNEIDQICDEFEQACRAGDVRRIEDVLAENTGVDRSRLLRELLLIELEIRQQQGEPASADDYVDRFPNDTDVVGAAVETILLRNDPAANEETVDVSMNAGEETYVPKDAAEAETIVPGSTTELGQDSDGEPGGKQFGDYELLHEIARGGMGVVYKARQTKLNRIVALKMIKSGELAGDEEVKRFHAEAEAAAALDHPGIVPIYEVGQHNDQHFFSMGFVDGAGLDAQLKEGPLPPKDAAGLIKTIAEAVQYAHDKGIVHRDLKPANVLLAEDAQSVDAQSGTAQQSAANQTEPGRAAPGHNDSPTTAVENPSSAARAGTARLFVPKITDFGLAKNIAGDSGMTATGQVLGTPSYMPPEQAAGNIEQVGPLADVYSLGAMLYATLTGRPPFQSANVMETLKQVLEREPVSPSQLNPAVDKDLETIVLKCLEKEAAKRYPTARDFASDLECYLTGKPISARPISRPARVWRWCKRNPLGATVAGLLLFLAIAGPAVAIHQIETNRQLDNALAGEKIATATAQQKEQETATALAKVKVALANEQAALKRKDKALLETEKSIDAYVEVVKNAKLLKEPRFKPLLKDLLKDALAHYTRFIEEHKDEQGQATRFRIGKALFEIGVISQRKGSQDDAISAYRQAFRIQQKLARDNSTVIKYQNALAKSCNNLGLLYQRIGRTVEATEAYRLALEAWNQIVRHNPTARTLFQHGQATTLENLALMDLQNGKTAEAIAAFREALAIRKQLAREHPSEKGAQYELAHTLSNLAGLYWRTDKREEGMTAWRQALMIRKQLAQENPAEAKFQNALAETHFNLGIALTSAGDTNAAARAHQQALKIQEQLARKYPAVTVYQQHLAATYNILGVGFRKNGDTDQSLKFFQQALKIREKLARDNPATKEYSSKLAATHNEIGRLHQAIGQMEKAVAAHQQALSIRERLARDNPTVPEFQYQLAVSHRTLGTLHMAIGEMEAAVTAHQRAIKIGLQLARGNATDPLYQSFLAVSYNKIGDLYMSTRKTAEALKAHHQAVEIQERLARKYPTVMKYQQDLAVTNSSLGIIYRATRRTAEALKAHLRAKKTRERLVERNPTDLQCRYNLATNYCNLGNVHAATGEMETSLRFYEQARTMFERLAQDKPKVLAYQRELAGVYSNLSNIHMQERRAAKTLDNANRAIQLLSALLNRNPRDQAARRILQNSFANRALTFSDQSQHREAATEWRKALALSTGRDRRPIIRRLALSLARSGQHADATRLALSLFLVVRNNDALDLARVFAISANAVERELSGDIESNRRLATGHAQLAIRILQTLARSGFFKTEAKRKLLRTDTELNSLRHRDDFRLFAKSVGVELPAWARRPASSMVRE